MADGKMVVHPNVNTASLSESFRHRSLVVRPRVPERVVMGEDHVHRVVE